MAKILIVEDNEMNRDMLSRRLIRRGFEIVMAVDGAEGIAAAKTESPDLVLMDMSLPVVDGWEATRRLKADAATRAIPVIGLTAHAMAGDRDKGYRGRLRRLRHKAGRIAPAIAEDRGAARPNRRAIVSGGRLEHAVAAFLRQEFGASVTAIIGFVDILIEDARRHDLAEFIPDLERMRQAATQLSSLIDEAVSGGSAVDALGRSHLRHELRTPLNAIKGYGELLVEEIGQGERDLLLDDLGKVLDLADRLLGEIDRMVEAAAGAPVEIVGKVLQTIKPLGDQAIVDPSGPANRILVVDDNAANRDLLSRRLQREGYRVTSAAGGAAALTLIAAEDFDLVLLDLMMPGMSGFEVLSRLKADESTRHLPVIMISALDELDSTVRCIAGWGRGLSAQAVQSGAVACAHRRLSRKEAAA